MCWWRISIAKRIALYSIPLILLYLALFWSNDEPRLYMIEKDIFGNFHQELSTNYSGRSAVPQCDYTDVLLDTTILSPSIVFEDLGASTVLKEGGEYMPRVCKPKFSVAIIVPYREQVEELKDLLVYLHSFLQTQRIHYRLYVVEQVDTLPFNKNELLNIGAVAAIKAGFPCLILHDVELLPLIPGNLYACTEFPRCLSSNVDPNSLSFSYEQDLQGVVAIKSSQFKEINGLSNMGYKTNKEDEALYRRLKYYGMKMYELPSHISKYYRLKMNTQNNWHYQGIKRDMSVDHALDGLNSLHYTTVDTVLHPMFTHIMVDLV